MTTVQKVSLKSVYPIRHLVLRKEKPIESCYFVDDEKKSTLHFGVILEDKIVGVGSLFEQKNELINSKKQFQIRGMAILEEHHDKGFGTLLLHEIEAVCSAKKATTIWFNAREKAVVFYKKLGYEVTGKPFDIQRVGIHIVMKKTIKS